MLFLPTPDATVERSPSARDVARACLLVACVLLAASRARADVGSIDLRNGGRMRGTITEVVPRDHATVVLPDGTTFVVPWSEIAFVFDGPRVFDGAGNQTTAGEASPAPATPEATGAGVESASGLASPPSTASASPTPGPVIAAPEPLPPPSAPVYAPAAPVYAPTQYGLVPVRPIETDMNAYARYRQLPRRSWSILMIVGGGFGSFETVALFGAAFDEHERAYVAAAVGVAALSGLLIGFGFKRLAVRRRGLNELRQQGFFIAGRDRTLTVDLDLGVDLATHRVVPGLTLRF